MHVIHTLNMLTYGTWCLYRLIGVQHPYGHSSSAPDRLLPRAHLIEQIVAKHTVTLHSIKTTDALHAYIPYVHPMLQRFCAFHVMRPLHPLHRKLPTSESPAQGDWNPISKNCGGDRTWARRPEDETPGARRASQSDVSGQMTPNMKPTDDGHYSHGGRYHGRP